ncbi:hypothetical protein BD626DRAFT_577875 [Schizophyllum amplum]|uniref:Uncharacterized protein n=1 Tax=Schizophyllum amplum TaxID=97359 RepID=A0A550BSA8_9AGAR|nr:hypothetical protein BD626DRAFT_577875 [Auriculariopsis ampla]
MRAAHPQKQLSTLMLSTKMRKKAARHLSHAICTVFKLLLGWSTALPGHVCSRAFDRFRRPIADGYLPLADLVGAIMEVCNEKRVTANASIIDVLEMACVLQCVGQSDPSSHDAPASPDGRFQAQVQWRTASSILLRLPVGSICRGLQLLTEGQNLWKAGESPYHRLRVRIYGFEESDVGGCSGSNDEKGYMSAASGGHISTAVEANASSTELSVASTHIWKDYLTASYLPGCLKKAISKLALQRKKALEASVLVGYADAPDEHSVRVIHRGEEHNVSMARFECAGLAATSDLVNFINCFLFPRSFLSNHCDLLS